MKLNHIVFFMILLFFKVCNFPQKKIIIYFDTNKVNRGYNEVYYWDDIYEENCVRLVNTV